MLSWGAATIFSKVRGKRFTVFTVPPTILLWVATSTLWLASRRGRAETFVGASAVALLFFHTSYY